MGSRTSYAIMKVRSVEFFHVAIPCPKTFFPAWLPDYPQKENRFTLVRLTTKDGHTGIGAGPSLGRERAGLGKLVGPYLVGLEADDVDTVRRRLREASFLGWRNPWIEAAFLDLLGRLEGKPVCELLGGQPRRLPAYGSVGLATRKDNVGIQVANTAELGVDIVKLRARGQTLREDRAMLEAAAEEAKLHDVRLAIDANQGWRVTATGPAPRWDLNRAKAFAEACEQHDVAWLEEPLDMHDVDGMAALRESTDTPIAGAELIGDLHAFRPLFDHGCLDIYQPDATLCGGAGTSLEVAERCREEGLGFNPHTWTNGIGLAYNAHILAASGFDGPLEWPYDPPAWTPEVRDGLLQDPLSLRDGGFRIPERSGLGIRIDEDALDEYGQRFHKATPARLAWKMIREKGVGETIRYALRQD